MIKGIIMLDKVEIYNEDKKQKVLKSNQIKEMKHYLLQKNKGKCAIGGHTLTDEDSVLDHLHKETKKSVLGENGAGFIRSVLDFRINSLEGIILSKFYSSGCGNIQLDDGTYLELPNLLRNLADYLEKGVFIDDEGYGYIHPTELPKAPILQKDNYNKLVKELKRVNYPNKIPEYPKSGNMTQPLQKLYEMVNIIPEYYKK